MLKTQANKNSPYYDLEERTFNFARECRDLIKSIPKTVSIIEDGRQLTRSSGSVAGNYIEANECLSKKDFYMRIRICRKEAKESCLWLKLLDISDKTLDNKRNILVKEAIELTKIFGSIVSKSE